MFRQRRCRNMRWLGDGSLRNCTDVERDEFSDGSTSLVAFRGTIKRFQRAASTHRPSSSRNCRARPWGAVSLGSILPSGYRKAVASCLRPGSGTGTDMERPWHAQRCADDSGYARLGLTAITLALAGRAIIRIARRYLCLAPMNCRPRKSRWLSSRPRLRSLFLTLGDKGRIFACFLWR